QMVREEDRLCSLEVRVARHGDVEAVRRALDERLLRMAQALAGRGQDLAEVEPLVQRDLIVARASRVELAAHGARQLDQPALDVRVNVLELGAKRERAGF